MVLRKKGKEEEQLLDMLSRGGKVSKERVNKVEESNEEVGRVADTLIRNTRNSSKARPSSFSLTEEDENCLAGFAMWLMSQGVRTTNRTLVVRTALRLAEKNEDFLETYNELSLQDKRRKK